VKLQIAIAAGERLSVRQEDLTMHGAALECRIYAEDPENSFFPSPGRIIMLRTPAGPGVRDDSGVYEGWTVPNDYDPLISKLVTWGSTRAESIARMLRALREYRIEGIRSNIPFFLEILDRPDFRSGDFDTSFIDRWLQNRPQTTTGIELSRDLAAIVAASFHSERGSTAAPQTITQAQSPWKLDARRRGLRNS
jgi:acetyl-CoA carboxylase biotin carboxylase subunit